MKQAQNGDTVRVRFSGHIENGAEFASNQGEKPLEFTIGDGKLIQGFEQGTVGMQAGEKKTIRLEPDQAFGEKRPELIQQVPKSAIPEDIQLTVGLQLHVNSPDGTPVKVTVSDISEEQVTLDANSPLAGEVVVFDLELVEFA
jgi:peptidylprolyl isomerase